MGASDKPPDSVTASCVVMNVLLPPWTQAKKGLKSKQGPLGALQIYLSKKWQCSLEKTAIPSEYSLSPPPPQEPNWDP